MLGEVSPETIKTHPEYSTCIQHCSKFLVHSSVDHRNAIVGVARPASVAKETISSSTSCLRRTAADAPRREDIDGKGSGRVYKLSHCGRHS